MSGWIIFGWVMFGLALLLLVWFFSMYNALVRARNNTDEAFSTMDVCMKKRYDLVPNLVETVKGYAKHEQETLQRVVEARNLANNSVSPQEKMQNEKSFSQALKSLLIVAEQYPELKANQNFMDLQQKLNELENEIAYSRKYYNAIAKELNNKIDMIPTNLVAKMMRLERRPMYELDDIEERKAPNVKF